MSSLIQLLKKKGVLGKRGPCASAIESLSLAQLVHTAEEIESTIRSNQAPAASPVFSHSASTHLAGGSDECARIACRIGRVNTLARFAVMYSDSVFIPSFFSDYADLRSAAHLEEAKKQLYEDLLVVQEIRTLVERGLVEFFAPETDVCFSCQAEEFLGPDAGNRFSRAYKNLQLGFLQDISASVVEWCDGYLITCRGHAPYFDHANCRAYHDLPKPLSRRPAIQRRIARGNMTPISKTLIKELGLHTHYAHQVASNAMHGLATSRLLNTAFLTANDLHVIFLDSLYADVDVTHRNNIIAAKYLTSIVPFLEDVAVKDLVKLRRREAEAFILYRKALNDAIGSFVSNSGAFTEKDAKSLYADVIQPCLSNLEIKTSQAKRDLIAKPLRSVTGVVGAISFGLLTGLLPQDTSQIAAALGLLKVGADVVKQVMALDDADRSIKNEHFYFLWKVKKTRKRGN
jgi:hypothetical protein